MRVYNSCHSFKNFHLIIMNNLVTKIESIGNLKEKLFWKLINVYEKKMSCVNIVSNHK